MNIEPSMTYWQCLLRILWHPWFDFVQNDAVCGNGFQIAGYGLWLILKYAFFLLVQIVLVVLFPFSAALMWHYERKRPKREKEAWQRTMDSL